MQLDPSGAEFRVVIATRGARSWALVRAGEPLFRRASCGADVEGGDAEQVVGGPDDEEPGPVASSAAVAELAAPRDGLDPTEGFFDERPDPLAGSMSWVSGGARIDGAAPPSRALGDVGVMPRSRQAATKPAVSLEHRREPHTESASGTRRPPSPPDHSGGTERRPLPFGRTGGALPPGIGQPLFATSCVGETRTR